MNIKDIVRKSVENDCKKINPETGLHRSYHTPNYHSNLEAGELHFINASIKLAHGIFCSPDTKADPMYIISLRSKQVVFSHDCALYLHSMISTLPDEYTVTVKTGYNPSNLKADGIKVFTIKSELHNLGLTYVKTTTGWDLPTYNIERTICDVIRSRNDLDSKVFQVALKNYAKQTDRNIKLLMDYARKFRVDKILIKYLEVLL